MENKEDEEEEDGGRGLWATIVGVRAEVVEVTVRLLEMGDEKEKGKRKKNIMGGEK